MRPANLQITDYRVLIHNGKWKLLYKKEIVDEGRDAYGQIHEVIAEYVENHHMICTDDPRSRIALRKYDIYREEE